MSWKEAIIDFFDIFGPLSLGVLSFTESIIQPVPPDLVYIPMLYDAMGNTSLVLYLWGVVTISSVLGSLVGYWLGKHWGVALVDKFASHSYIEKLEVLTFRYGTIGIFIAAFSPIPYKVFGWLAGMGEMNKKKFVIAGFLGRGLRFGLEAMLIGIYGKAALDTLDWFLANEILLGIVMILGAIALFYTYKWWNNLTHPDAESE